MQYKKEANKLYLHPIRQGKKNSIQQKKPTRRPTNHIYNTKQHKQKLSTSTTMAELESPEVMPKVINFLSCLLHRVAESNDTTSRLDAQRISVFHGLTRPTISIQSYLERIFKYANCSPSCFIVAYVYLDRFTQKQPLLPINSFNVHRLLITSVLVSAKFMDDM